MNHSSIQARSIGRLISEQLLPLPVLHMSKIVALALWLKPTVLKVRIHPLFASLSNNLPIMYKIKSWWTASTQLSAYPHWLQTHKHVRLVMTPTALCCQISNGSARRARTNKQTDRQTDGCYQIYYLPPLQSINSRNLADSIFLPECEYLLDGAFHPHNFQFVGLYGVPSDHYQS